MISATAGTAAAVIVAGCAFAATSAHGSGTAKLVNDGNSKQAAKSSAPAAPPLRLLSVSPSGGTKDANGGAPVTLTFSAPLSPTTPLPAVSPKTAGSWKVSGATATFTPASGFLPDTKVTLGIPGGMTGAAGGLMKTASTASFTTGSYSTLRLQQILSQLGYLPLTWTPTASGSASSAPADVAGQAADAYAPPSGTFTFKPGYPSQLTSQWEVGQNNMLDVGAIRAFEYNHGLTMDGVAGPEVWAHLLTAAAKNQVNASGYTYALASQDSPETLKVWHNGKVILDTPSNTGIAGANTQDGTFPVYEKLQFQVMKGTNPDGSKYSDPVYWISYFNGGDAVHYFDRASYGFYQSLGCVELPLSPAKFIWPYLTYGTLVTVTGPVA
jgi:peptidoglycan hydrolase-like protein with peptidoglycan-binding domain